MPSTAPAARKWLKTSVLFLLVAGGMEAQSVGDDAGSLHAINGNFLLSREVTLQWHNRLRSDQDFSRLFQFRTGPILFWQQNRQVQWISGYYFVKERSGDQLATIQRPFAGIQFRVLERERHALDWRNLLERHIGPPTGDFTRFRSRLTWTYITPGWQPFVSAEGFALRGTMIGRGAVGLNWVTSSGHQFGFGYEYRQGLRAPGIHVVFTAFQFAVPVRK